LYVNTSAANFDRPFDGSDKLFAYGIASGRQQGEPLDVKRQYDVAPMGLAGMAMDADGDLYIADMNGRVDHVDPKTGEQDVYATIPTGTNTAVTDMPTFVTFDRLGNLYVGDAGGEPIVWRIPPGGGEAEPWFVDPRLAGSFGASVLGLAVDPSGENLYIAAGNQQPGVSVYRLPLASPDAAHLEEFHRYNDVVSTPCEPTPTPAFASCVLPQALGAGGIAFGASGKLYVVFLSKNQLSILRPDGSEELRFPSAEDNARLDVPLCGPFDLAFDGHGSLLVSNGGDATWGDTPNHQPWPTGRDEAENWVVYDIYVGDTAATAVRPTIAG
jgi:streptogramin lyase